MTKYYDHLLVVWSRRVGTGEDGYMYPHFLPYKVVGNFPTSPFCCPHQPSTKWKCPTSAALLGTDKLGQLYVSND